MYPGYPSSNRTWLGWLSLLSSTTYIVTAAAELTVMICAPRLKHDSSGIYVDLKK